MASQHDKSSSDITASGTGTIKKPSIPRPSALPTLRKTSTASVSSSTENLQSRTKERSSLSASSRDADSTLETDTFIIGDTVWIDGNKRGRISYIGATQFAKGEWAGVVLDEPAGKNDGMVSGVRYFQCDSFHGTFTRLTRLSRKPLNQIELSRENEVPGLTSPKCLKQRSPSSLSNIGGGAAGMTTPHRSGSPLSPSAALKLGDRVIVQSSTSGTKRGVLRFIGTTEFAEGEWAGIELDGPQGKNDGSVQGTRYFTCAPAHGLFAPVSKVSSSPANKRPPSSIRRFNSKESLVSNISSVMSTASRNVRNIRKPLPPFSPSHGVGAKCLPTCSLQSVMREMEIHLDQLMQEKEIDRQELAQLNNQLAQRSQQPFTNNTDMEHIQVELDRYKQEAILRKAENEKLVARLNDLMQKLDDLQFSYEEEKIFRNDLQSELHGQETHEVEISRLSTELLERTVTQSKLDAELRVLKIELAKSQQTVSEFEKTLMQLKVTEEKLNKLQAELIANNDEIKKLKENEFEAENLKKQLNDLSTKLKDFEENESILQKEKSQFEFEMKELQISKEELEEELKSALEKLSTSSAHQNSIQSEYEQKFKSQIAELEVQLNARKNSSSESQLTLLNMQVSHQAEIEAKEAELLNALEKTQQLETQLESSQLQIADQNKKLVEVSELKIIVQQCKDQEEQYKTELALQLVKTQESNAQLQQKSLEIDTLDSEKKSIQLEFQNAQKRIEILETSDATTATEFQAHVQQLESELARLKTESADNMAKLQARLDAKLSQKEASLAAANATVENMEVDLRTAKNNICSLTAETASIIESKQEAITNLEAANKILKSDAQVALAKFQETAARELEKQKEENLKLTLCSEQLANELKISHGRNIKLQAEKELIKTELKAQDKTALLQERDAKIAEQSIVLECQSQEINLLLKKFDSAVKCEQEKVLNLEKQLKNNLQEQETYCSKVAELEACLSEKEENTQKSEQNSSALEAELVLVKANSHKLQDEMLKLLTEKQGIEKEFALKVDLHSAKVAELESQLTEQQKKLENSAKSDTALSQECLVAQSKSSKLEIELEKLVIEKANIQAELTSALEISSAKLVELQSVFGKTQKQFEEAAQAKESLKAEMILLTLSTDKLRDEMNTLRREKESIQAEHGAIIEKSGKQVAELEMQLVEANKCLDDAEKNAATMNENSIQAMSKSEVLLEELSKLNEQKKTMEGELQATIEKSSKQEADLETQLANARKNLELKSKSDSVLSEECFKANSKAEKLQDELDKLRTEKEKMEAELRMAVDNSTAKLVAVQSRLEESNRRLESAETNSVAMTQECEAVKAKFEKLQNENRNLATQYETTEAELRAALEAASKKLTVSESLVAVTQQKLEFAQRDATKLEGECTEIKSKSAQFEEDLKKLAAGSQLTENELRATIEKSSKKEADLKTQLADAQKNLELKLKSDSVLSDECFKVNSKAEKLQDQLDKLRTEKEEMEAELRVAVENSSTKLVAVQSRLEETQKRLESAETSSVAMTQECGEVKAKLEKLRGENNNLAAQYETTEAELRAALEATSEKLTVSESLVAVTQQKLEFAEKNATKLDDEFTEAKSKSAQFKEELKKLAAGSQLTENELRAALEVSSFRVAELESLQSDTTKRLEEATKKDLQMSEKCDIAISKLNKLGNDLKELLTQKELMEQQIQEADDLAVVQAEACRISDIKNSEFQNDLKILRGDLDAEVKRREAIEVTLGNTRENFLKQEKMYENRILEIEASYRNLRREPMQTTDTNLKMVASKSTVPSANQNQAPVGSPHGSDLDVRFLNSIIVDLRNKNEELSQKLEILLSGNISSDHNRNLFETSYEERTSGILTNTRLYCDICEQFDLHDTMDCPTQASEKEDANSQHHLSRGTVRQYCTSCEVFGHTTEECDAGETY